MTKTSSYPEYVIGVMTMDVEGKDSQRFYDCVEQATQVFDDILTSELGVRVDLIAFEGPHLMPSAGAYAPLDFLQIGMTEKIERGTHFLLIVTEVDLATSIFSYTLALPSQLTNVGIVSTKRLNPTFWGHDEDNALTVQRLTTLMIHTFGHLLNLSYSSAPQNLMYDFASVENLVNMSELSDAQRKQMWKALPREAHERTSRNHYWRFIIQTLIRDWPSIVRAVVRANPFRLLLRLPTMVTAALSVIIFLFFGPEVWDVGSTVEFYQLVLFAIVSMIFATAALYRAFAFGSILGRGRVLAESTVVTSAATAISLMLTMVLLFAIFMGLTYLGTVTIFPRQLMETWPTVDPAITTLDHVKVSMFVGALGLLAGSLGGRADSKDLVRGVLFVDDEI